MGTELVHGVLDVFLQGKMTGGIGWHRIRVRVLEYVVKKIWYSTMSHSRVCRMIG